MSHSVPHFDSVEQVKEFISKADSEEVGFIHFMDEDGNSTEMSMNDFIKKVGLDNAAKFIFERQDTMKYFAANGEEILRIMNKFLEDPKSLTDEEKMLFLLSLKGHNGKKASISKHLFTVITKSFVDLGQGLTKNYSGFLSVMLTMLQDLLIMSSDLSIHVDNKAIYDEILNSAMSQISIPDDMDDATLLLALFEIIGRRFVIGSDFTKNAIVNYREFAEEFGLDTEFIFGNTKEVPDDIEEMVKTIPKDFLDLNKQKNAKPKTEKPSIKNSAIKPDIRQTLKKDKK